MNNPLIASRYAKSLIELAQSMGQLEAVYQDARLLNQICKESRQWVTFLKSPVIKPDKKEKVVEQLLKERVQTLTYQFIRLLIRKEREAYLPEIARAIIDQYFALKGIHRVSITTAVPVSQQTSELIIHKLQEELGWKQVELQTQVDPRLIGGFVLQTGDRLLDASIYHQLQEVKKQFLDTSYVYNIR
ncbi:ATP synthase F1 subcomplex delta subunit [Thermoflavifilum aggregans]|uniref:ATP synthase subunit delta n=1 Tax=Thermoflavifilum aggregans TaxID=454188 RepID=A0A2M9CT56_9BACT|nr:ATP synthase F1 subunit delta [Thermoflavifilum aggregans]PJJ75110.1 ATP synthase F1 subcomplex delta subunit [Thermoflavifilum aggregans]